MLVSYCKRRQSPSAFLPFGPTGVDLTRHGRLRFHRLRATRAPVQHRRSSTIPRADSSGRQRDRQRVDSRFFASGFRAAIDRATAATRRDVHQRHAHLPDRDASGTLYAFEIRAQLIGWKVRRALRDVDGVSDVRPRRWWVGSPEIHIRFTYREREYIVWEPFGDNSRWWIGPDDTDSPHEDVEDLERAIASR